MEKTKKIVKGVLWVILGAGMIALLFSSMRGLANRTWVLVCAQQAQAPWSYVAHGKDLDVLSTQDPMFQLSKPVELICEAKGGKLVLTDQTNGNTYEGTYTANSAIPKNYNVVIDGIEGTANITSDFNRTLYISVGGYLLHFSAE